MELRKFVSQRCILLALVAAVGMAGCGGGDGNGYGDDYDGTETNVDGGGETGGGETGGGETGGGETGGGETGGGETGGGSSSFDSGLLQNGDFSNGVEGWEGNARDVRFEGDSSYNFADVFVAGNSFDVNLSQPVAIEQGKTYTLNFKAASNGERTLVAGIGLNQDPWTNNTKIVDLTSEWQAFSLTVSAPDFGNENSRVLFDMGAAVGQVLIDEVSLTLAPFDSGLLQNGGFDSGSDSWIGNAANVVDDGSGTNNINMADVATAGSASDVNLSQVVSIEQGKVYRLGFKAKSDAARSLIAGIGLNQDPWTNDATTVDLTAEWQTFNLTLSSADFGGANSRVLFDMGAATGQVQIDDVLLAVVDFDDGLLINGDFESGASDWIGNAANVITDNDSKVNFADIASAGNPFDVNLSQIVAIEQGNSYTLSFKAKSDGSRTLDVGIGLNQEPWTNDAKTVNLTAEWQTFTVEVSSAAFGNANSRVLFDMGAATGQVFIDEVSLVKND